MSEKKIVRLVCSECGQKYDGRLYYYNHRIKIGKKEFFCSQRCVQAYKQRIGTMPSIDLYSPFRKIQTLSKNRNKDYDLDLVYLKNLWNSQHGLCPITGWSMILPTGSYGFASARNPRNASLDRINSEYGYIRGNVRFLTLIANLSKHCWDDKVVQDFCTAVVKNN